jgi:hypothetical protein
MSEAVSRLYECNYSMTSQDPFGALPCVSENRSIRSIFLDEDQRVTAKILSPIHNPLDSRGPVIVKSGFMLVIGVCSVIGNSIALTAFRKSQRLRTKAFTLLFSLTVADLVTGMYTFFYIPYILIAYVFTASPCDSITLVAVLTGPARYPMILTISHVGFMSVERFIAVSFPLYYEAWITEKVLRITIAVAWILPGIMSSTFFLFISRINWTTCTIGDAVLQVLIFDISYILFVFILTVVLYSRIMMTAMHQRAKIKAQVSTVTADRIDTTLEI